MTKPLVSVIIPFYSNIHWLVEAIDSVFTQTYENLEVILVNDGSTEDISIIEKRYDKLIIIYQENSGPASARNTGIRFSSGEYIAFLDSDDLWIENKLELQIDFMLNNNLLWSHTNYIKFYTTKIECTDVNTQFSGNIMPLCFIWNPIATPTVIINKAIFVENKNLIFEESIRIGEDSFLWQEIAKIHNLGHLGMFLSKVRIRGKNAAYDAYKQLNYRSNTINRIINHKYLFNNIYVYYYFIFILIYCKYAIRIIKIIGLNHFKLRNSISNLFYIFPYLNFKIIKYLLINSKKSTNVK